MHTEYIGEVDDQDSFLIPLQDVVNQVDSLKLKDDRRMWADEIIDEKFIKHNPHSRKPNFPTMHVDEKMCEVNDRKEAFSEINCFLRVNDIVTDYTTVRPIGEELFIKLWNKDIEIEFLLSNKEHERKGYFIHLGKRFECSDGILPSVPDKYFAQYIHAKENTTETEE